MWTALLVVIAMAQNPTPTGGVPSEPPAAEPAPANQDAPPPGAEEAPEPETPPGEADGSPPSAEPPDEAGATPVAPEDGEPPAATEEATPGSAEPVDASPDVGESSESEGDTEDAEAPPLFSGEVEELDGITEEQHEFLKPKRHLLEQNPYAQVDFTAYTLEWGEVMLGVTGINMGVAPRVQLGTQPAFDLLGLYNLSAKANLIRIKTVDLGLIAQGIYVPLGDFRGSFLAGGATGSAIIVPKWSIHAGLLLGQAKARGIPNAPPLLLKAWVPQDKIDSISGEVEDLGFEPNFSSTALIWRFATDYRLNRRDSIVLQAQGLGYGSINASLGDELHPVADEIVNILFPFADGATFSDRKLFNPFKAYVVTVSWQFSWQQIGARLGGGWSADKVSWLFQANDLNYRFWGKTRLEDRRRKKGWKKSGDEVVE